MWHGDVCHGPSLLVGGSTRSLRIQALLEDASRYIVALEAHRTEMESDMLGLLVRATRRHGAPDDFYLDSVPPPPGLRGAVAPSAIALFTA